jgi:hypothetical protein
MASTQILLCPCRLFALLLFGLVDLNAPQLYPRPDYWGGHHVRSRILFPPLQPESARSSRTCPWPAPPHRPFMYWSALPAGPNKSFRQPASCGTIKFEVLE